jgi:hypothetical protein
MYPTLKEGQLVLCRKLGAKAKLNLLDIYAYITPYDEKKYVVKRLLYTKESQMWFEGDNKNGSLDSRTYGFVPRKNVRGKVIYIFGGKSHG